MALNAASNELRALARADYRMKTDECTLFSSSGTLTLVSAHRLLNAAWKVVGCCLLVGLGAQIRIPMPGTDVPATLQLLAVLLTGLALAPSAAAAAMLLYLACGAAGLPAFTPGSTGLVGSTGGYLVGFVAAAYSVSILKGVSRAGFAHRAFAAMVGALVVFTFGITWRVALASLAMPLDGALWGSVATGFVPFAAKTMVEVLLAAATVSATEALLGKWKAARTLPAAG